MIDGFGWFPEPLYRRNWLLFDAVDYAFPLLVKSVSVPPKLAISEEFDLVQPDLGDEEIDRIARNATADAADATFRAFVESEVPRRDAQYAGGMVYADRQIRDRRMLPQGPDPVFAMSYLAHKLVAYANSRGSVPIVGQDYALKLLSRVVRENTNPSTLAGDSLVTGRQALNVHAIAAGLSLRFVSDDLLAAADMSALRKFKEKSTKLRQTHHLELLKIASEFDGFPIDATFPERLATLRANAEAVRNQLDLEGKDLWVSAGLDLAEKVGMGAATSAVGAIALIHASVVGALVGAIPGAIAGSVFAISKIAHTMQQFSAKRRSYVSYLTDAHAYLARA